MDSNKAIDLLVPGALFFGSMADNTEGSFNTIQWYDERPKPTWAEMQVASAEAEAAQRAEDIRLERDKRLTEPMRHRDRHRDEVELGVETTLDPATYNQVLLYIQALRDVPQQPGFPDAVTWPTSPL